MIRRKSKLCKLFQPSSLVFSYDSFLESYNSATEVCPYCQSKGNCKRHAYYYRHIINSSEDRTNGTHSATRILRVKCSSCNHTHAVLPDFVIPYRSHSLSFIVQVLQIYFSRSMSINRLCKSFSLSKQLFHIWKTVYLDHRSLFLGALKSTSEDLGKMLDDLYDAQTHPFLRDFFLHSGISFLQSHANPTANLGRSPYWNTLDEVYPHNNCSNAISSPNL